MVGGAGFEPAKASPPDLQSGPFGRSGIPPQRRSIPNFIRYLSRGSEGIGEALSNRAGVWGCEECV